MHDRCSPVTTDGIWMDVESDAQANKDSREADYRADSAPGRQHPAALFRKITSRASPQRRILRLSTSDRVTLEQLTRSRVRPHRQVVRSQIVLMAHEGSSMNRIALQLGVARSTVRRWCRRFAEGGVRGLLHDAPGRGRRPGINPGVALAVLRALRISTGMPTTIRRLAAGAGTSASRVWRIFRRYNVQTSAAPDAIDAAIERVISETRSSE